LTIGEDRALLQVPARAIPIPASVSPEAQAVLAMRPMASPEYPPLDDVEGWRKMIEATDAMVLAMFCQAGLTSPVGYPVDDLSVGGVPVFAITPADLDPADTRVYLDIHGGAFIVAGGEVCRATATMTARKVGMRLWSVDYRMPPDHPHPSAVDDCLVAYRALLEEHRPEEIVVGGTSAGGNLSAALILRARDEGLPLPAAAILLTPALDLTQSGDSFRTNLGVDTVITTNDPGAFLLYAGGHDLKDPYLSPLFGDLSKGFPPTLLASGTRDVLLSDTVRMHRALRAAGVPAELHVLEAAPHGFFRGRTPEDRDLDREVRRFIEDHCPARRRSQP
jgi:monoterpene epsilon-lactone hydrolase